MAQRPISGRWPKAWRMASRVLLTLSAAAFIPSAIQPARAEVRIGGDSNGYFTVKVMSWWEIPFRTVVRQRYDFSCGSAAIATLLTYHYNRPTNERAPFTAMWNRGDKAEIRKIGFSMLDMKNYLGSLGLRAQGFRFDVDDLRQVQRPAIALLDLNGYKHFVVIKGVSQDKVLVGDPMLGIREYSVTDFAKYWNGILLAIVEETDRARPIFNLVSDWGPWSRAPVDANITDNSVGRITTHLPPSYQISPQVLIDLRGGQGN